MITKTKKPRGVLASVILVAAMLTSCAAPPSPMPEAPPSATEAPPEPSQPAPAPAPTATPAPPVPAPRPTEVRSALERIYKDAVTVADGSNTSVLTGDFNGDGSVDLAVIVQPSPGRLDEINSDVAGWLIRDPQSAVPDKHALDSAPISGQAPLKPVQVAASDTSLLVIVHGYGPQGWRDPDAQQSYLLKRAIGGNPQVILHRNSLAAIKKGELPPARGDMIRSAIAGYIGILYYDGSSYVWQNRSSSNRGAVADSGGRR